MTAVGIASIGLNSSNDHLLPTIPVMQTIPPSLAHAQRIQQRRGSHQFQRFVNAARKGRSDLIGNIPGINKYLIGPIGTQ